MDAGTVAGISGITFVVWEIMLAGRGVYRGASVCWPVVIAYCRNTHSVAPLAPL